MTKKSLLALGAAAGLAATAVLPISGALAAEIEPRVTVTAVVGEALGGEAALAQSTTLAANQPVSTGEDGACALLVDRDALVQLCAGSRLSVDRRQGDGVRVVQVESGEARIVLDPGSDERVEIHTPAAIATLLGTVVYVRVDEKTGETTITSADHDVEIHSAVSGVTGSLQMRGGEQVTMRPGEAPPVQAERLASRDLASLGGCLVDLERAALQASRVGSQAQVTERVASVDVAAIDTLPGVGSAVPSPDTTAVQTPGEAPESQTNVLRDVGGAQEAAAIDAMMTEVIMPPPPCELAICQPGP